MSSIPYNYGKYISDKVALRDQGHVDSAKQISSPASAGSRGLAKTTQFTNDPTQMKMGNTPIAESMVEIRNILNRIDGVNVPVQEKRDNSDIDIRKLLVDISSMKDRIAELAISDDAKTSAFTALAQVEDDIAQEIEGKFPEAVKEDAGEDEKVVDMLRNIKQHLDNHPNMREHPSLVALDQLADDLESGDKPADYESVKEDDGDERAIAAMKLARDEDDDSEYIKQAYMLAVKHHTDGSGDGNINEDIGDLIEDYNEKADKKISPEQIMRISKKYNAGGDYVEVLSAEGIDGKLWLEVAKKKYSQLESAVKEEAVTDGKILSMISDLRDAIMEHPDMENDQKTAVFTAIEEIEQAVQGIYDDYEPFPEEDEMTFEDDDAFYEAFGELGFPEADTELFDAEYRGRKVPLNKPMRGDVKKFKVYVKDPKTGNVKKVNFGHGGSSARKAGQKTMKIRKSNPKARKSFRARHNCANPGPKTKARYWSCRKL